MGPNSDHTTCVAEWTSHSKPFDLVWKIHDEDLNGLPINPQWGYQLDNPGKLPDFASTCGSAFYNAQGQTASTTSGSGNNAVNSDILKSNCTSQSTFFDISTSSYVGDWALASLGGQSTAYCTSGPNGFNGHLTWTVATYMAHWISWSDWSGNPSFFGNFDLADGDYDLLMDPTRDMAAYTSLNNSSSGVTGLNLEFKDGETVDNAGEAWWQQVVNAVESGGQPDQIFADINASGPGPVAVITGVVGIDGVHGDYAEIHPVYALALLRSYNATNGQVLETWDYFLRNSGSGGGCSSQTLYWEAPQFDADGSARYFIGLPWPDSATDVKVVQNTGFSWQGQQPAAGSWVGASSKQGWTEVDIVFHDKSQNEVGGVDGEVTLQYTVPAGSQKKAKSRPAMPAQTEKDKEDQFRVTDFAAWLPDPAVRAKYQADATASLTQYTTKSIVKAAPASSAGAPQSRTYRTAASNGELTPPKPATDTVKQNRDAALKKLTDTYRPNMHQVEAPPK